MREAMGSDGMGWAEVHDVSAAAALSRQNGYLLVAFLVCGGPICRRDESGEPASSRRGLRKRGAGRQHVKQRESVRDRVCDK